MRAGLLKVEVEIILMAGGAGSYTGNCHEVRPVHCSVLLSYCQGVGHQPEVIHNEVWTQEHHTG